MPDIGEMATEREFKRLTKKLRKTYQQAYEDIYKKQLDFVRRHEKKEAQYRQAVKEGRMQQADFDAWMRGQVFQGDQWEAKRKQMQQSLYAADKTAREMINDSRYSVFAENANFVGYELEKGAGVMTSFNLYDANSVARLLKEEPDLLPPRKIPGRDKSYKWYNGQIQSAITQGIIQGETIRDIAKRVAKRTGESNMKAAIRQARTMYTGAQNAGRLEGMHQAQELGIKTKKQWSAMLDDATRDAHRHMDGQVKELDEPFISELGKIMYPGDPKADPANVWNCHCRLRTVYPEYPDEMKRRDNETGEIIGDISYEEWAARKRQNISGEARRIIVHGHDISATWVRRPNEYDYSIDDVVAAQGYDGLPSFASPEEFDRICEESSFVAQRVYTAPDEETLVAYKDALYGGEFYVSATNNGRFFGGGMYCAANTDGNLTDALSDTMEEYRGGSKHARIDTFTLHPSAKIAKYSEMESAFNGTLTDREKEEYANSGTIFSAMREKQARAAELRAKYDNDIGAYIASLGYDATVVDTGGTNTYAIVYNRSKVIFRRQE